MESKTCRLILLAVLLYSGCWSALPTISDARKIYEKQVAIALKSGKVKLVDFREVDGTLHQGNDVYKLEWEADLEFLDDITLSDMPFDPMGLFVRKYKKGDKDTVKGFYYFYKTENGWVHRKM